MNLHSSSPSGGVGLLDAKKLKIALVVMAYFIVSISLVFSNKVLLSSKGSTIEAPLFVTWFQVRPTNKRQQREEQ
jgi:hypothetical protein